MPQGNGVGIELFGRRVPLSAAYAQAVDRDCLIGLRPEAVHVAMERSDGAIPVELDAVTPLNVRSVLLLRTASGEEILADPFRIELPTILVANKCELVENPAEELQVLQELVGVDFPSLQVSAETGAGCDQVGPMLFQGLQVVRVYSKAPGKPADTDRPFTLRKGQTVLDFRGPRTWV